MPPPSSPLAYMQPLRIGGPKKVYSAPDDPAVIQLRDALLDCLRDGSENTVIPLLLEGKVLAASCHAAVLGPVLKKVLRGDSPGRYIVVHDPDGTNDWDADAALRKKSEDEGVKLLCVWIGPSGEPQLVGAVDPAVQETYFFVLTCTRTGKSATARVLAEEQGIRIQAASNRMSKAASFGVIHALRDEPAEGGGTQRVYVPIL